MPLPVIRKHQKLADHMVHLSMATGGKGQGDIAFTQPSQRRVRVSETMVRHQQGAVHIKCRQFAAVFSPM